MFLAEALSMVVFDAVRSAVRPLLDDMKEMEARLNIRFVGLEKRMGRLEKRIQSINGNMSAQFVDLESKIGKSLGEDKDSPDSNGSGALRPPARQP